MENVKYIQGDLVMTNGVPIGTAKDVVYRVTASSPNRTLTLESGEVLKGVATLGNADDKRRGKGYLFVESGAWIKDIIPIKLTPQILEDNGWKLTRQGIDDDKFLYSQYERGHLFPTLIFYPKTGGQKQSMSVLIEGKEIMLGLHYLHELQHLLFGLGLNHKMKI